MAFPALRYGMRGPAVKALQHGVARWLRAHDLPTRNHGNGGYGAQTRADVGRLKHRAGLRPVNGRVVGSRVWQEVAPFLDAADRRLIAEHSAAVRRARARRQAAALRAAGQASLRTGIVAACLGLYARRDRYVYRQERPMPAGLFTVDAWDRLDCSSTATLAYKQAGAPDPNGYGYNGYGWTGSLWPRGRATARPRAGDLAFYGSQAGGIPSHVAVHIDDHGAEVISFGSTPVKRLPVRYRGDYRGSRTYL